MKRNDNKIVISLHHRKWGEILLNYFLFAFDNVVIILALIILSYSLKYKRTKWRKSPRHILGVLLLPFAIIATLITNYHELSNYFINSVAIIVSVSIFVIWSGVFMIEFRKFNQNK